VRLVHDKPHRVDLEIVAARSGYVVLSDTFYGGWRARLDGEPVPILRANGVSRAVATPAGVHRLSFLYDPAGPRLGFFLTLLALTGATGVMTSAAPAFRGRKADGRRRKAEERR
jgi:uncharacterized membrane protein YfhO